MFFVPVVSHTQKPLMPTTILRARRWIQTKKATPFYSKGVFCVRLNIKPKTRKTQKIAIGIDPGSKREAYTIKSKAHTYLNVLSETPWWIKSAMEQRRNARRARRFRNTRYRISRLSNRKDDKLAPSTRARWQLKLNISKWLKKVFPTKIFVVEDTKAKTRGRKRWDVSFSPLQVGKNWFYSEIAKLGKLTTKQGYETKDLRDRLGLKKSKSKLADKFECHNVDSWVLANSIVKGHLKPDNKVILKLVPLQLHRRQLHYFQASKGGVRRDYGGTRSLGFKRGSLVRHTKLGLCYVGGTSKGRISLHCVETGKRLTQVVKVEDCEFLTYGGLRRYFPAIKAGVSGRI